jgi:hypothetical protein
MIPDEDCGGCVLNTTVMRGSAMDEDGVEDDELPWHTPYESSKMHILINTLL